ncbi:hypothetical protein H5201_09505 [Pseudoalteromonas sp. SG43-6]|uniref:hypothetical protein n=1 Tax=Pseudoalteromonas sp. SG43-6 TaxID=2760967 RepID=UPI0016015167|nr:hypothetical protein [Pseudoalteromonas sp. SG43-6]MBB1434543.1 hypothetical protein [Pseudoalteromonas sp. SG43-6]
MSKANKKNNSAKNALIIAVLSVVLSVGLFYCRFGFKFNAPMESWVETAIYFNNILSPIFLLITIFLLYWTWKDTRNGLKLQRDDARYQAVITSYEKPSLEFLNLSKEVSEELGFPFIEYYIIEASDYLSTFDDFNHEAEHKIKVLPAPYLLNLPKLWDFVDYIFRLYKTLDNDQHQSYFITHIRGRFNSKITLGILISYLSLMLGPSHKGKVKSITKEDIEKITLLGLISGIDDRLINGYQIIGKKILNIKILTQYLVKFRNT